MKTALLILALLTTAVSVSGCIIAPYPGYGYGYYRHPGYSYHPYRGW